jgi:hypothetical protein
MDCLDAADHDLKRALELATARILMLQCHSGAGHRRFKLTSIEIDHAPQLLWSTETTHEEHATQRMDE